MQHLTFPSFPLLARPRRAGPALHLSHLRPRYILADNLPAEIHKRLVDILPPPRRRFIIRCIAPILTDGECPRERHGPVFFKIRFIAYYDERDALVVFDAYDLVTEFVEFGQGGEGCYAEDEEEALAGFHVEFAHCGCMPQLMRRLKWEEGMGRDALNCSVPAVSRLYEHQRVPIAYLNVQPPYISSMHCRPYGWSATGC